LAKPAVHLSVWGNLTATG